MFSSKPYLLLIVLSVFASACTPAVDHYPLSVSEYAERDISGLVPWRGWGDERIADFNEAYRLLLTNAAARHQATGSEGPPTIQFLAISGGGADGAFGVGLLDGWTKSGTRPVFDVVTGVSTGAIIAPFAFLGKDYDAKLVELYGSIRRQDVYREQPPLSSMLFSSSFGNTKPLAEQLAANITPEIVAAIAEQGRQGRRLLVSTTHFDALRPMVWDLTQIAEEKGDEAGPLIRQIILASASIPVLFPPVPIEFEDAGQRFTELHVDGGVSNQVFAYPPVVDPSKYPEGIVGPFGFNLYVIQNGNARTAYSPAPVKIGPIAERAIGHLIRSHGNRDIERIYYLTQRDGIEFYHASIPSSFNADRQTDFDRDYMDELLRLGRELTEKADFWNREPPA